MSLLQPLLASDPASPRLTVYDEDRGTRMEFSAQTLDNWASKVANMLEEEFDLAAGDTALIDLAPSWQSAVIALGAYNAGVKPEFAVKGDATASASTCPVVFTSPERAEQWPATPDVVVVSDDPFGRGVEEAGGALPAGAVDFGPTVRFYGDAYFGDSPDLGQFTRTGYGPHRYLSAPWSTAAQFEEHVLAPLAAGGSVVVATGLIPAERLDRISQAEKVTHFLTQG